MTQTPENQNNRNREDGKKEESEVSEATILEEISNDLNSEISNPDFEICCGIEYVHYNFKSKNLGYVLVQYLAELNRAKKGDSKILIYASKSKTNIELRAKDARGGLKDLVEKFHKTYDIHMGLNNKFDT
jgi:hypothetical protein